MPAPASRSPFPFDRRGQGVAAGRRAEASTLAQSLSRIDPDGGEDRGWQARPEARQHITQPPSTYLRRFYYDCIVYTEAALRYLIDSVGVDRVVFGTDWPYDMVFDWPVSWILSLESLTRDEKEAILWKNLERLLSL